jgi:hypothetical protein
MSKSYWFIGLLVLALAFAGYFAAPTQAGHVAQNSCDDPFDGEQPNFGLGYWEKTDFCQHNVDYDDILSGGPPPDGIPALDNPKFESATAADSWLAGVEPVISLIVEGEAKAYPLQIMTWHEIVNDEVGGLPVAVTFCPLCNTALVFERFSFEGEILTFGTSGNLRNSDLVMYDRQTESWWQQFTGEGIVGYFTDTKLTPVPAAIVSWADFKASHPEGMVLSRETGFSRSYGQNPYVGYDNINSFPFLFDGALDDQLKPMDRVIGVVFDDESSVAYTLSRLSAEEVINDTLGDTALAVFWKSGTASALDTGNIADGNDIGATGVFNANLDGDVLVFSSNGDGTFSDENTSSTWDIFGNAIDGPLVGMSLKALNHHDTFWFAWAAFVPGETLSQ